MVIHKQPISKLILLAGVALVLPSCTTVLVGAVAASKVFESEDVNLTARNYAVADYMIKQTDTYVTKRHLIKALPLHDALEPQISSSIGRVIPEQIGTRLAQLGYRVDLDSVSSNSDTNYLKPVMKSGEKPRHVLSGTYLRQRGDLKVSLRITDTRTSRIVSSFEYTMPVSREIDELSDPKPMIFRTSN